MKTLEKTQREGAVRVVKVDSLNYAVQVLKAKKDKDGADKGLEWVTDGYYGCHHLQQAFNKAVHVGMPEDQAITRATLQSAIKSIEWVTL